MYRSNVQSSTLCVVLLRQYRDNDPFSDLGFVITSYAVLDFPSRGTLTAYALEGLDGMYVPSKQVAREKQTRGFC
jgi:hypothetical protein